MIDQFYIHKERHLEEGKYILQLLIYVANAEFLHLRDQHGTKWHGVSQVMQNRLGHHLASIN